MPARIDQEMEFTDISEIFKLIRKYIKEDKEKYIDLVTAEEKANLEDAIKAVEDAAKGDDPKIIQDLVQAMFKAMGPLMTVKQQEEEKAKATPVDDNVVDAEVKESV